jgi:hypothetical protein
MSFGSIGMFVVAIAIGSAVFSSHNWIEITPFR